MLQRPTLANAFKFKNGFKILYTQISWGTLSTQREEDKRVRRGKDAAKGATVIFWRLAGGEEEELLALRVLLFDLVAIFFEGKILWRTFCRWPPNNIWTENGQRMVDESTLNLMVILHGTTQTHCIVVHNATDNVVRSSTKSLVISSMPSRRIV